MPAKVTAPILTDDVVLFHDKEEAQLFFDGFTVPDATRTTAGSMFKAAATSFTNTAIVAEYNDISVVQEDGSSVTIKVVTKDAYDNLVVKYNLLSTALKTLIDNLRNAGHTA